MENNKANVELQNQLKQDFQNLNNSIYKQVEFFHYTSLDEDFEFMLKFLLKKKYFQFE